MCPSRLRGIYHSANWRTGRESILDLESFLYISFCGRINSQLFNISCDYKYFECIEFMDLIWKLNNRRIILPQSDVYIKDSKLQAESLWVPRFTLRVIFINLFGQPPQNCYNLLLYLNGILSVDVSENGN
jgi:hypothetical protein